MKKKGESRFIIALVFIALWLSLMGIVYLNQGYIIEKIGLSYETEVTTTQTITQTCISKPISILIVGSGGKIEGYHKTAYKEGTILYKVGQFITPYKPEEVCYGR